MQTTDYAGLNVDDQRILNECEKHVLNSMPFMAQENLKNLFTKYPQNPNVIAVFARSCIDNLEKAKSIIKDSAFDDFAIQLVLMEIHLLNKDESSAYSVFKNIKEKWPSNFLTNCYEVIFCCYIFNTKKLKQYLDKAKNILETIDAPTTLFEEKCNQYVHILCEWVVSANQSIGLLNIAPYWKKFTESIFEYGKEYLEEQQRIIEAKKAEEQKRKEEEERNAAEMCKKAAEEKARQEFAEMQRAQEIARLKEEEATRLSKEQEKQKAARFLNGFGISLGSFKDERDGNEYKTITIGTQTWMIEPLRYVESDGLCSLDKCVEKRESGDHFLFLYTWAAMNCRKINKLSPVWTLSKIIAFLGVVLATYMLMIFLNVIIDFSEFEYKVFSYIGGGILFVAIAKSWYNFFETKNYSIISKTIAPKGWKIPTIKDLKFLAEYLKKYTIRNSDVNDIDISLGILANTVLFRRRFWLSDIIKDYGSEYYGLFHPSRMNDSFISCKSIEEYQKTSKNNDMLPIICIKK